MWQIIQSSLPEILWAGIKYTIPIAVISFAIGLVIAAITALVRIPMRPGMRSLNLATAAAIGVYEAWRQLGHAGAGLVEPDLTCLERLTGLLDLARAAGRLGIG